MTFYIFSQVYGVADIATVAAVVCKLFCSIVTASTPTSSGDATIEIQRGEQLREF